MGTRADFYIGRGETAEWLGSIAWDGYPDGIDGDLFAAREPDQFRAAVTSYIEGRRDGTLPAMGWPWPWDDSRTTDYAYALDDGKVYGSCFGHEWFAIDPSAESFGEPDQEDSAGKVAVFPDMRDRSNFTLGARSGVMVFGGGEL